MLGVSVDAEGKNYSCHRLKAEVGDAAGFLGGRAGFWMRWDLKANPTVLMIF